MSDTANNSGYRFVGWYREPDVTVNVVDESHDFFDPIVSDEAKRVGDAVEYTAENTGPANTTTSRATICSGGAGRQRGVGRCRMSGGAGR